MLKKRTAKNRKEILQISSFIRRRSPEGKVTTIAGAKFQDVRWMTVTPDGTVYLIDLYDLTRLTPDGAVRTVARGLASWNLNRLAGPDRHAVMGLWTDALGNVYAAVAANGAMKRIAADGSVRVVARSRTPWSPSGGFVAPNGDLWVLEYSILGAVQVRLIQPDGRTKVFN